jgi:hypothetical protein
MATLDFNRLASSAAEAYLREAKQQPNGKVEAKGKAKHRRLGTGTAVAVGVGLTVAAQAAYRRVRNLDLEQLGGAVEDKLKP